MNIPNKIKNIFLVLLFATVAVETTVAMQGPAEAAPVTQAAKPQETCTCKWMIPKKESCDQTFDTKQKFYDHVKEKHFKPTKKDSAGKFHCRWKDSEACTYKTPLKDSLQTHIKRHTKERPHACNHPGCPFAATNKGHLIDHMRTHTGERPFVCNQCGASFAQMSNLRSHKRTHAYIKTYTYKKLFACNQCTKSFVNQSNLIRHKKKKHENPSEIVPPIFQPDPSTASQFICQYCSIHFNNEVMYENHLLDHLGLQ